MGERLSNYTKRLLRERELNVALDVAERHCLKTHDQLSRMISGIAVTGPERVLARGLEFVLPLPLLGDHDCATVLGRVTSLTVRSDCLLFVAEICNSGLLAAAEQAYEMILLGETLPVSIAWAGGHRNEKGVLVAGRLEEISLVADPADRDACVRKAWLHRNAVVLSDRTDSILFDEARSSRG
jgi:hypothetical protein